jgi:hypothetical protein
MAEFSSISEMDCPTAWLDICLWWPIPFFTGGAMFTGLFFDVTSWPSYFSSSMGDNVPGKLQLLNMK